MVKRYDQWHHLTLLGDKQLALRYLAEGRKYLGMVAADLAVSGNQQGLLRRRNADGVLFTARIAGEIPVLTIDARGVTPRELPLRFGGFVTWPTDAAGADALAASARIVLAGAQYRAVREPAYSRIFPDGLDRAGNVDWQGKGWVLSWYGPRTRYIDGDPPRSPFVFTKGLPIVDARDHIDTDAVVLGAAVTTAFGTGTWLVVVTEEFRLGRFEDVWVVRLVHPTTGEPSGPLDTAFAIAADSYQLLDSRSNGDSTLANHPWLFNPTGTEARTLVESDMGDLTERILQLVADEESDCGFIAQRDAIVHPLETITEYSGFTSASYGFLAGKHVSERRPTTSPPPVPSDVPDETATPVVTTGSYSIENGDSAYQASPLGMLAYEYAHDRAVVDPWQPIAVDYTADGEVVRGYGRQRESAQRRSGGMAPPEGTSLPVIEPHYTNNAWSITSTPIPGVGWTHTITHNPTAMSQAAVDLLVEVTRNTSDATTVGGVKVGAVEALAERIASSTYTGTLGWAAPAFDNPGAEVSGAIDPEAPMGGFEDIHGQAWGDQSATLEDLLVSSEVEQTLYLVHMDLRYDALFVVIKEETTTSQRTQDFTWAFPAGGSEADVDGTLHTVSSGLTQLTWRTRGWVHGALVVDEAEVTREVPSASDTTTPAPAPPIGNYENWGALCLWHADYGSHSNILNIVPEFVDYVELERNPDYPVDAIALPTGYVTDRVASEIKPAYLYQVTNITAPTLQELYTLWHTEVEAGVGEVIGYSFGALDDESRVKVKWHTDADGVPHCGGWAYYQTEWAFSMALPAQATPSGPFQALSLCRRDAFAPRVLSDEEALLVEHFYPVWALPNSNTSLLPPP